MKKLFKILLFFVFFTNTIFASVILKSSNYFVKDEAFIFEFEVSGSSITFPKITKIDDFAVQDLGTSKSLQIINGNYSEKISKKYEIIPNKNFTIPSFTFEIDGKKIQSQKKQISEKKISKTISSDFSLELKSSENEVYVGEEIYLKLIFKYKKNLQITNLGFQKPHFENFWYERIDNKNKSYEENSYIVQELDFVIFAQKAGLLRISPLKIEVQLVKNNSSFGNFSFFDVPSIKKVYSNSLEFKVKNLPQGVNLIGDFDIEGKIDKTKIKEGEAITLKLKIQGSGNFDDIKDYDLNIKNATVYGNKPKVIKNYENLKSKNKYEKIFSIIPTSEKDIIVPSIELKYFDKKKNQVFVKKTKEFFIEVTKNKKEEKSVLQKSQKKIKNQSKDMAKENKTLSSKDKIIFFLAGVLFSLLIFGLISFIKLKKQNKKKNETPLLKRVKASENSKELLKVLIPYLKYNEELDKLILECENTKDFKTLKKEISFLVKKLKIKG